MTAEEYVVQKLTAAEIRIDSLKERCDTYKNHSKYLEGILEALLSKAKVTLMDNKKGIYIAIDAIWEDSNPAAFATILNYLKTSGLVKEEK